MTKIILNNISKSFKEKTVFEKVNLNLNLIEEGKIIAIKGKSGVGKSTLLNIIAGLEKETCGNYQLDNIIMNTQSLNSLAKIRKNKIGYISQFSPMIPKLTALENICIPLMFDSKFKKLDDKKFKEIYRISEEFGVNDLLNTKIDKLSGGEIQRIGIIRSIVNKPSLIVADEPTGSLDDNTAAKIMGFFQKLKKNGTIIILATHSQVIAEQSDTTYILSKDGLQQI